MEGEIFQNSSMSILSRGPSVFLLNISFSWVSGSSLFYCFLFCNDSEEGTENAMAPHSSTLAWKIPWTEEPGRLQSMGSRRSDTTERLHFHFSLSRTGEGTGNPLQCSCLENPRDSRAWWAAVYGVAQSQTRLTEVT